MEKTLFRDAHLHLDTDHRHGRHWRIVVDITFLTLRLLSRRTPFIKTDLDDCKRLGVFPNKGVDDNTALSVLLLRKRKRPGISKYHAILR